MSQHETQPQGDGGEAWLSSFLEGLELPDTKSDEKLIADNPALKFTLEDYNEAPEEAFAKVHSAELALGIDTGEIRWGAIANYAGNLLVRQYGNESAEQGYLLLGGSIYLGERLGLMELKEKDELTRYAWQQSKIAYGVTDQQATPFVIRPGSFCQNASLYYRRALTFPELRKPGVVDVTLTTPLIGSMIAVEHRPGKTMSLLVADQPFLSQPIRSLHRVSGDSRFDRF